MIDLNKPEPPKGQRQCAHCLRKDGNLQGTLIHWPSATAMRTVYFWPRDDEKGINGIEPFSMWVYICRWCRGWETRRENKA